MREQDQRHNMKALAWEAVKGVRQWDRGRAEHIQSYVKWLESVAEAPSVAKRHSILDELRETRQMIEADIHQSKPGEACKPISILASEMLLTAKLPDFLARAIQKASPRLPTHASLVFRATAHHNDLNTYFTPSKQPCPLLLLFQTAKGNIFGAYSASFNHHLGKSNALCPAFLSSLRNERIIARERESKAGTPAVVYGDNQLTIGNSEVVLRNRDLQRVRVNCGSIMGTEEFGCTRGELTGEKEIELRLERVEIFELRLSQ